MNLTIVRRSVSPAKEMSHSQCGRKVEIAALLIPQNCAFDAEFRASLHTRFTNCGALRHCAGSNSASQSWSEVRRVVSA